MNLLLDTQILVWAAGEPAKLSVPARELMSNLRNDLFFSAASLWELTIKAELGREDFSVEPRVLRRGLIENGYSELSITAVHALSIDQLPPLHKDPFDRILVAQASSEGMTLVTADARLAQYPGAIIKV